MGSEYRSKKKKPIASTIIFGAVSAGLYAALFYNAPLVMKYFTKGFYYAALPIATAFAFSFVHGAFASNVWSLLGIEAMKKQPQVRPEVATRPASRKRPRPRVHMSA